MNKVKILIQTIIGNLYKIKVWFHLWFNINPKLSSQIAENVIVSLTSYGCRVSKCSQYAIFSMLKQTRVPEKIVLWLDKDKWNNKNLPFVLKRIKEWGLLEVEYCEDVRSYTKLIPALEKYPDKIIITIDDDIYYSDNLIEQLYFRHQEFPEKICAISYCIPTFNSDHSICTYSKWNEYRQTNTIEVNENLLMPQGFAGVLYPIAAFDAEILNKKVFLKQCPMADDIWFYVMAIKSKTLRTGIPYARIKTYNVDLFRQLMTKDRLHDKNVNDKENDLQLKKVLQYYNMTLSNNHE